MGAGGYPCSPYPTVENDPNCPYEFANEGYDPSLFACSMPGLACSVLSGTDNPCEQPPYVDDYVCCGGTFVRGYDCPDELDAGPRDAGPADAGSSVTYPDAAPLRASPDAAVEHPAP